MNTLTLSNTAIRQLDGLYSLNDLHKAAGSEEKHAPSNFIRIDNTKALIAEIQSAEMQTAMTSINGGPNRGTYVCRELVYAYAMWISAKFSLLVIRAFDSMVNGNASAAPTSKPKALPQGLSLEQQDTIKALVRARVNACPSNQQAKAAITCWSALKAKFGCTYKKIDPQHYAEALSLVSRLQLDGEGQPNLLQQDGLHLGPAPDQDQGRIEQGRAAIARMRAWAQVSLGGKNLAYVEKQLESMEVVLRNGWTEVDEAMLQMAAAMAMLRRWKGWH